MKLTMKPTATPHEIAASRAVVRALGLNPHVSDGPGGTVIVATGASAAGHAGALRAAPGVEGVVPIRAPYLLASRETRAAPTVVRAGSFAAGGGRVGVIAGPCSVESEEQILRTARAVAAAGATALRGGAFKPRTSPYSFQGLKADGLRLLAAARDATGLAVVTEVVAVEDLPLVTRYADMLQIGARNMQNYRLLEAVGESGRPVLLKRGPAATVDELLLAAEYVLDRGNRQVLLCERGVRTFETHTRFTLPLATVPYLRERTHLPVAVDPSHGTGLAGLVGPMAAAAVAAGADALLVEVHPDPARAASDGDQSLTFGQFADLMATCRRVATAVGRAFPAPPGV